MSRHQDCFGDEALRKRARFEVLVREHIVRSCRQRVGPTVEETGSAGPRRETRSLRDRPTSEEQRARHPVLTHPAVVYDKNIYPILRGRGVILLFDLYI